MSIKSYFKRIRALIGDRKGAALPEFAVAIFPLLWLFFTWVQVSTMFTAHLVLHHAAVVAARCAIIQKGPNLPGAYVGQRGFFNGSGGNIGTGGGNPDGQADNGSAGTVCRDAAIAALGQHEWYGRQLTGLSTDITYSGGQYDDVTTVTKATYTCHGPILARRIVCPNGTRDLSISIVLPHEGARYTLEDPKDGE
jgi:hypothetical protein